MAIWIVFALMTGAAVLAVLWPLSRRPRVEAGVTPDARFYRDQLGEIERDQERGLLSPAEAEAARAEAARRLLRAAQVATPAVDAFGEPALRRRRAASGIALSSVPLVALAVYGAAGSPQIPAQPLAARLQADPQQLDLAGIIARVEAHLAAQPQDGRGWEVIAPVYLRGGRFENAVTAYRNALRLLGDSASRLADYGEALVGLNDGIVSAEARAAFTKALAFDGARPKAHYYLARAAEQEGDRAAARTHYEAVLSASAPDAPWLPLVRQQLARLEAGSAAVSIAALGEHDRAAAVRGMVESLAERLSAGGGTAEEWARLVRSYAVLGERDKAQASLSKARQALAEDRAGLGRLDAMAEELALRPAEPAP
jgi:cytochrome c-type biogenesis protein CcmH